MSETKTYTPYKDIKKVGFHKEYYLFPELAEFMGVNYCHQGLIVSYIASYAKLNSLINPQDRKFFKIDEALSKVFGECGYMTYVDITRRTIPKMREINKGSHIEQTYVNKAKLEKINRITWAMGSFRSDDKNYLRIMRIRWTTEGLARLTNVILEWNPTDFQFYSAQKQSEILTWLLSAKFHNLPKDMAHFLLPFLINAY